MLMQRFVICRGLAKLIHTFIIQHYTDVAIVYMRSTHLEYYVECKPAKQIEWTERTLTEHDPGETCCQTLR